MYQSITLQKREIKNDLQQPNTMFFSSAAHFLKICNDNPAWSIPGVANTTLREKRKKVKHNANHYA